MLPKDIQSALTEAEARALGELAAGRVVLECGAWWGYSTIALAQTAARVHSVDWHRGDEHAGHIETLSDYLANLARYDVRDRITVHVGRFEEVLPMLRGRAFEGCFLDGQHDRASVERDLRMIRPLIRRGGWIALHDYGLFEVEPATTEFTAGSEFQLERVVDTLAVLRSEVQLWRRAARRLPLSWRISMYERANSVIRRLR